MALADLTDYVARYGTPVDGAAVTTLLGDVSSLIEQESGQTIVRVTDDVLHVEGKGTSLIQVPQLPVVSIASIEIDGVLVAATSYRLLQGGARGLVRSLAGDWPCLADVKITCTHGYDPVPDWIVALACSTVRRSLNPQALEGVAAVAAGTQRVEYASSIAGVNLWFMNVELARIRSLGPAKVR